MKLLPILAAAFILGGNSQTALAADPGEAWFTEAAGSGVSPDGVQWLPVASLCSEIN